VGGDAAQAVVAWLCLPADSRRHASVCAHGMAKTIRVDLLCAGSAGDVAIQSGTGTDTDGPANHLQGALRMADDASGLGGCTRAGTLLDARGAMSGDCCGAGAAATYGAMARFRARDSGDRVRGHS